MATILQVNQTIRNVRRYGEILGVLVRHGFGDVIHEMKLDRLIERGMAALGVQKMVEFQHLPRAVRLRKAMEELGPTFIKLGQVLSTRPDLVPEEWVEEFKRLQDQCPEVEFKVIREILDAEFPDRVDEIFASIDPKPLAAASIAQVHKAVLRTGEHVVIKVLRPRIHEITESDMEVLGKLAEFAEEHFSDLGYSPKEVVREFARELKKEVDLTHEGQATDRLRASFEDDAGVKFPEVYWDATTSAVLTLEEIRGIVISRITDGQVSKEDRRKLVANGARAVMRQCLEIGFFHADPHPGNLIALPGGVIAFIDCGMTGQLDTKTAQELADLVTGVVTGDLERVIGVVAVLGDVEPLKLEERTFRADVRDFVSQFQNTPLERLNMGRLLDEFFAKLRQHRIRCPGDLIFLIKALTTIESVGASLDPEFDMVSFATPYIERLVKQRYGFGAVRQRLQSSLLRYAELAEDLPSEVRAMLGQIRKNRFAVNIEHRGLNKLTNTIEHASRNISFALIIAAMLVGSSILVNADRSPGVWALTAIGIAGFAAAAVMTILMVITNRRYSSKDK